MEFRNHTPFPALTFQGTDSRNTPSYVLALRQTLTWDDDGKLSYSDEQIPFNTMDQHFGEPDNSAVRQESDLCQFKPHCDVIVNATAYAPKGKPDRSFNVRLRLSAPIEEAENDLPAPPQGLNPLQQPSEERQQAWLAECEKNRDKPQRIRVLLDKTLTVLGERWFVRRFWPRRVVATSLRWISLGTLHPATWRLTRPQKTLSVPLHADRAFGGQCQIATTDKAAKRVAKRHRLKARSWARDTRFSARAELSANPAGRGWARHWYLKAKRLRRIPAPQIEHPGRPVTTGHFTKAQRGKLKDKAGTSLVAGLGIHTKRHPERSRLLGCVNDDAIDAKDALPEDFAFGLWNAAWPDQLTRHLRGDETLELVNLCDPNATGVRYDRQGNTILRLTLPRHDCFALLYYSNGRLSEHPLVIDTLIVEPETQTLSLVWRAKLDQDPAHPLQVIETRMRTFAAREQLGATFNALLQLSQQGITP